MQFVVEPTHPCLPGHFPGNPLVPGVVILDRVLDAIEAVHGPLTTLRLPQVKFIRPLLPGETATVAIEGDAARWKFKVLRGDALLASGELVADAGAAA